MSHITGITVGTSSIQVLPARHRRFLGIYKQNADTTVWIAFDRAAAAGPTQGQLTLLANPPDAPAVPRAGAATGLASIEFSGEGAVPSNAIHMIADGPTPLTIIE